MSGREYQDSKGWSSLTVAQLKQELRERRLKVSGNKAELIDRLSLFSQGNNSTLPSRIKRQRATGITATTQDQRLSNSSPKRMKIPVSRPTIDKSGVQPRLSLADSKDLFCLVSWNVAGIRAFLRKEEEKKILLDIINDYSPKMLCIQETKLQNIYVPEIKQTMKQLLPDYESYWTCSEGRKGYSGNVVFVQKSKEPKHIPLSVSYGIGDPEGDLEGRSITVEYEDFFVIAVYVPNSGDKLKRLEYRIQNWDRRLKEYMKELERKKPVILVGDLNVAHEDVDFFNPEDPRTKKQAATTPEERNSFAELLSMGYVDTFRWRNPEAKGAYTYWSQRAQNRPFNRGLRLDYFVASSSLVDQCDIPRVMDSFIFHEETERRHDHCPIGALMELKNRENN